MMLRVWMKENKAPVEKINMFFAREEDRQRAFKDLREIKESGSDLLSWK